MHVTAVYVPRATRELLGKPHKWLSYHITFYSTMQVPTLLINHLVGVTVSLVHHVGSRTKLYAHKPAFECMGIL